MSWVKGCSFRTLKKYPCNIDQDGVHYNWKSWSVLMSYIMRLRLGHIILNPYKGTWDEIAEVKLCWKPAQRQLRYNKDRYWNAFDAWRLQDDDVEWEWPKGKCVGRYVDGFVVTTKSGYRVYDIEHWHEWWPHPLDPAMLAEFNKQINEASDFMGPWRMEK